MGLTKLTYVASSGIELTIHTKNFVFVIQDNVHYTKENDLVLSIPEHLSLCDPMNGNIGSAACLGASKRIKATSEHLAGWTYRHIDGIQSAIGCLQIYSDKSQTSAPAGAAQFHLFHVILQNLKGALVEEIF